MKIQMNTDSNVIASEELRAYSNDLLSEELKRFENQVTRLEIHLSDENGDKDGVNDKRCLIEARFKGRQPIVVTDRAGTQELAIAGAAEKLKASLEKILGRIRDH
ncbi:MAG: HPF/RaiA family ribosome-associated protein [Bacteroidia bacterium]|jgi:ribosome-associated translation inhibitor RaiA|nr:MAG: HPF/RaiA family ribosome-associated protein [Bacteroidia bacterium]